MIAPLPRVEPRRSRSSPRAGLVVFSPLPPMPTGIADYTCELLPGLARHYEVTVVTEDAAGRLAVPRGIRRLALSDYQACPPAGTHLYMLGNNPDHLFLLPTLARRPGVVVLHDPGLHHLLDCATAALGDIDGYCAAIEAEYGAPGRVLAEQWRAHHLRGNDMLYAMPMLRQLLGPARHVIVHSRYAALKVLTHAAQVPVTIAPHHYAPPAGPVGAAALRARLGIAADELVFLSLGFVSHIKRIDTAMRALARIARRLPRFRYVIAGEMKSEELDVAGLAARLGIGGQVLTTGFVAEADFFAMIGMADVVINLRHPMGGETSGTLIRALGSGACVVVVDGGAFAEIPDGCAVKLPFSADFETVLADALLRLAISPATRMAIGAAAARSVAENNSLARSLAAYRAAIDAAAAATDRPWRSRSAQITPPPQHPAPPAAPLWRRLDVVPGFAPAGSVLAWAEAADIAQLRRLGHAPRMVPAGWHPSQEAPRAHDLIFLGAAAGPSIDQAMLEGLNQGLAFGGVLVLHAPEGHWLAARQAGEAALAAAGFAVDLGAAAAPPILLQAPRPQRGGMVWRATKISEFFAAAA